MSNPTRTIRDVILSWITGETPEAEVFKATERAIEWCNADPDTLTNTEIDRLLEDGLVVSTVVAISNSGDCSKGTLPALRLTAKGLAEQPAAIVRAFGEPTRQAKPYVLCAGGFC